MTPIPNTIWMYRQEQIQRNASKNELGVSDERLTIRKVTNKVKSIWELHLNGKTRVKIYRRRGVRCPCRTYPTPMIIALNTTNKQYSTASEDYSLHQELCYQKWLTLLPLWMTLKKRRRLDTSFSVRRICLDRVWCIIYFSWSPIYNSLTHWSHLFWYFSKAAAAIRRGLLWSSTSWISSAISFGSYTRYSSVSLPSGHFGPTTSLALASISWHGQVHNLTTSGWWSLRLFGRRSVSSS